MKIYNRKILLGLYYISKRSFKSRKHSNKNETQKGLHGRTRNAFLITHSFGLHFCEVPYAFNSRIYLFINLFCMLWFITNFPIFAALCM